VKAFDVVGAIIVEASDWVEDNQWILDLAKDNSEIVGVVGNLSPGRPEFVANLRRFAAEPLFRGLRLRSADLGKLGEADFDRDIRRIADAGLAIDVLGGPAQLPFVVRLARLVPSQVIILNHLPFSVWDGNPDAIRAALSSIAAQHNIYIKISGVVRSVKGEVTVDPAFYRPALDALLDLFGYDRVMYGSNWPVSDRIAPYASVHRIVAEYFANQRRAVSEKFFWRNSLAAYQWQHRGATQVLLS
jgi:predicted TIM-barrel fold metal-dependent hydrolase